MLWRSPNLEFLGRGLLISVSLMLFSFTVKSQQIGNYVNNGSFEALNSNSVSSYYNVIDYWQPIDTNKYAYMVATAIAPIANIPYLQGYQFARSGKNYMLPTILVYNNPPSGNRGYPRNRLKGILKANTSYCVKFYLNSSNFMMIGTDSYGAYFGDSVLDTIVYCNVPLTYLTPQIQNPSGNIISDTLNWTLITGTFVATGTEKYMVLGSFKSDASTNTVVVNTSSLAFGGGIDVCIDDVSVIELNLSAYAGHDTVVTPGTPVFLGREPDFAIDPGCTWYQWPNMSAPIFDKAGLWVNPVVTTTYIVRQILDCSPEKWDTVVVTVDPTIVGVSSSDPDGYRNENDIQIFPNPASEFLELKIKNAALEASVRRLRVYNSLGLLIREQDYSAKIRTEDLQEGVYFLQLYHFSTPLEVTRTINKSFVIAR